jgi:hypothetical protein
MNFPPLKLQVNYIPYLKSLPSLALLFQPAVQTAQSQHKLFKGLSSYSQSATIHLNSPFT